jgi:hypothetical protein
MDTRLLGPKGMNGLKILGSTRLQVPVETNLPTRHQCMLSVRDETCCRLEPVQLAQISQAEALELQHPPRLQLNGLTQLRARRKRRRGVRHHMAAGSEPSRTR